MHNLMILTMVILPTSLPAQPSDAASQAYRHQSDIAADNQYSRSYIANPILLYRGGMAGVNLRVA